MDDHLCEIKEMAISGRAIKANVKNNRQEFQMEILFTFSEVLKSLMMASYSSLVQSSG